MTTKRVLQASSTHAANDREVAEREGLVRVFKNEFFNGPNLPGGNIPSGTIHNLRIVVAQALQDEADKRSLHLPNSGARQCNLSFISSRFFVKSHKHSLYDPACAVVEVHHRVKLYWMNNVTPKQVRQFKMNSAR